MTVDTQEERLGFEAEVRQLLDLMVHSLYSNKEIFLRELISNASDAADKLRFEALSDNDLYEGEGELRIRVAYDQKERTISVIDNGIGMSRQEVIDHLGTIAKSGTREFFQSLTGDSAVDAQLIGQFGVGFYSSFIVAERVTVKSRRAGLGREEGVEWSSEGEGEYTIRTIDRAKRGTEVVLRLREGEAEFLDGFRLRNIIKKYSDHISWPILMRKGEEGGAEEEAVNSATALWSRVKGEIGDEEYDEFYKHIAHDFEAPLARVHSRVEGNLEYTSLLFVPSRSPFDLWDRQARRGVKLYVRRVFIMDDAEQLMPAYLRFVRGVVDSPDLPLNISREILQQSKQIESIRAGSVKKVLGLLEGLAVDEPDKYHRFWDEFGRVLKEGVIEDAANREAIAKLLRFASTTSDSEKQRVSLDDYVGRLAEGQDKIYYITAANYRTARASPQLELFAEKGIEVLLLTDDVDEIAVMHLSEYDGKPLQSVARGDLDLSHIGEEQEQEQEQEQEDEGADAFLSRVQACLEDRVKAVRITKRLTTSPACLVADEHDMSGRLERLLRAAGQVVPGRKPIMELNPRHAMVKALREESDEDRFSDWAHILFDESLLIEGAELADPSAFVSRVNKMLSELADAPSAGDSSS